MKDSNFHLTTTKSTGWTRCLLLTSFDERRDRLDPFIVARTGFWLSFFRFQGATTHTSELGGVKYTISGFLHRICRRITPTTGMPTLSARSARVQMPRPPSLRRDKQSSTHGPDACASGSRDSPRRGRHADLSLGAQSRRTPNFKSKSRLFLPLRQRGTTDNNLLIDQLIVVDSQDRCADPLKPPLPQFGQGADDLVAAVNVSSRSLNRAGFANKVVAHVEHSRLLIEVTETYSWATRFVRAPS
jgi:hypothetical protein